MKNENDKYNWYEYLGSLAPVIILFGGYGGWWFGNAYSGTSILYWILLMSASLKFSDWIDNRRRKDNPSEKENTVSLDKIKDDIVYGYINPQSNPDLEKIEKIQPPENFFSLPRKIDWDELNKTRKYNGDLGELFVYDLEKNYLTKVGRSDLAEKVQHVASDGDGHGYDIKSFYENGEEKFIEVKATNASSGSTFNVSKNEFNFLQTHLNNAVVCHIHNVNSERETTVVIYPANEVVNSPDISPSGYVVKM